MEAIYNRINDYGLRQDQALASPEDIRSVVLRRGQEKPETINYRTYRPGARRAAWFCERHLRA